MSDAAERSRDDVVSALFPDDEGEEEEGGDFADLFAVSNPYAPRAGPRSAKRVRTEVNYRDHKVYTFGLRLVPVKVQLLSDHTLEHLVEALCEHCGVGEGIYEHMWNVRVGGKTYEGGPLCCETGLTAEGARLRKLSLEKGAELILRYDYGSGTACRVVLEDLEDATQALDLSKFPREKPEALVPGYVEYSTDAVDLNAVCPAFSERAFGMYNSKEIHFGRAGKKQHFGFFISEGLCADMLYLPDEAVSLEKYLDSLQYGCRMFSLMEPAGSWRSACAFNDDTCDKFEKFDMATRGGLSSCEVVPAEAANSYGANLADVYPKIAALMGKKKDKHVKRGWISYRFGTLTICTGPTVVPKMYRPSFFATCSYAGYKQYTPKTDDGVLRRMRVKITSLQQFFAVAEGLLRTLE